MTALLFISPTTSGSARSLDFAGIAGLFAEVEEPARRRGPSRRLWRAAAAALLVLIAIGDTLLVARPGALSGCPVLRPAQARSMF